MNEKKLTECQKQDCRVKWCWSDFTLSCVTLDYKEPSHPDSSFPSLFEISTTVGGVQIKREQKVDISCNSTYKSYKNNKDKNPRESYD